MSDYISREALIGKVEKHYCAPCKGQGGDLGGDWCRSCVINSVLEKVRECQPQIKLMNVVMYITLIGLNKAFVKILILTVPIPSIVALTVVYGLMTAVGCQNIVLNVGRRWKGNNE